MSGLTDLLNWGPVSSVRRNHALEHATINLLSKKMPGTSLAGYSDWRGFWIFGDVDTEELQITIDEALARLHQGESNLAIHANCGTNFVTAGFLVGTAAWLGMIGSGSGFRRKLDRWPLVISLVTTTLILSQPLGPIVQARLTTESKPGRLQVTQIMRYQRNGMPAHRVSTRN
jgi:hypothetical protein